MHDKHQIRLGMHILMYEKVIHIGIRCGPASAFSNVVHICPTQHCHFMNYIRKNTERDRSHCRTISKVIHIYMNHSGVRIEQRRKMYKRKNIKKYSVVLIISVKKRYLIPNSNEIFNSMNSNV